MAKILWSADYSVQSKYLDLQHQNLLMILNEFKEWLLGHILKVDMKYREYVAVVDDDL